MFPLINFNVTIGYMDIILQILEESIKQKPASSFLKSLHQQYCERGGLSKKQLEGLHHKISAIPDLPTAWAATLEAIIKKKPTRYKSDINLTPPPLPTFETEKKDVEEMLSRFPAHKRLLLFRDILSHNEILSQSEITEIAKFKKILAGK